MSALEHALRAAAPQVRALLEAVLTGKRLELSEALALDASCGDDLQALRAAADELRKQQVGDVVTYVVNRNINFTNTCVKSCKFCAFSRTGRSEEAYYLDHDEIVRRALQAQAYGATEVCIQAGLPPRAQGALYVDLLRAVKRAAPTLHVHAFSPEEVKYGAELLGITVREHLRMLKEEGLGSLPGTSAEILDDAVRKRLAGGRITTDEWIEVIGSAHQLGLPTTATIMHGHIERSEDRMRHLLLLRSLQERTGGFTELVPLSFVHAEAPLHFKQMVKDVRPGPTRQDVLRLMAIARLLLGESFRNLQTSWVKDGLELSQELLQSGANDLGGTLMNESISTAAGAQHGQLMAPSRMHAAIRALDRVPAERDTRYRTLRTFTKVAGADPSHPLDEVTDAEAAFGSYAQLTAAASLSRRKRDEPSPPRA
jgi:FO synthase subunit 2